MARTAAFILLTLIVGIAGLGRATPASCAETTRLVSVTPAREGSLLVCTLVTTGLPDLPSRETLLSGLPSALTLALTVLDAGGRDRGGSEMEIRIEPNLWEENFLVRTPLRDLRTPSLEGVREILAGLGPLPVVPLAGLDPEGAYRLRARMAVHPLASAEVRRARSYITGETLDDQSNRREVSMGLGALVRFFLGDDKRRSWTAELISAPFVPARVAGASADPGAGPGAGPREEANP